MWKRKMRQRTQLFAPKKWVPLSLGAVLGLGTINWLAWNAIAPQVVHAYAARQTVSLSRQGTESYESLLQRAQTVARTAAQRLFDSDILIAEVEITVTAEYQGAIAPILLLQVSRQAWRAQPDPQGWSTYFPDSQSLLNF